MRPGNEGVVDRGLRQSPAGAAMPAVRIDSLTPSYPGGTIAADDLSLEFAKVSYPASWA